MKEVKNILDQILPQASEEDMVVAIGVLITEANENSKRMAIEDPLHQQAEETYVNLHRDAYRYNLHIDLADFELEHPEMNVFEIDHHFRSEWDI